jgi:hypothetical protein
VRDPCGQASDARELLHPYDLALHVQQILRHRAITGRQQLQLGGFLRRVSGKLADSERVRFVGQPSDRHHHESMDCVGAAQDEDHRATEP